jgi:hypothetical protein
LTTALLLSAKGGGCWAPCSFWNLPHCLALSPAATCDAFSKVMRSRRAQSSAANPPARRRLVPAGHGRFHPAPAACGGCALGVGWSWSFGISSWRPRSECSGGTAESVGPPLGPCMAVGRTGSRVTWLSWSEGFWISERSDELPPHRGWPKRIWGSHGGQFVPTNCSFFRLLSGGGG